MKNLLTACLPALALFALGGCAGTSALTSSEDDGVYYSSQDRTTAVVRTAPAPTANSEEANPDYNDGNTNSSSARQNNSGSDQYYDNNYTYMRGAPGYGGSSSYYGPGLNSYSPYSPYTSLGYGGGFAYGGGACGFSPYAFGGYDPFYSPFGYGYGSGLNVGFGFGRSFGYGGFGGYSPFGYGYSPFGYGGYGGYDPFFYGSPFYGGYYGRGGYYGNSYYGNAYSGNGGYYNNGNDRGERRYGSHRTDRASDGRYSSGGAGMVPGTTTPSAPNGSGRVRSERVMPNTPESMPMGTADAVGRTRSEATSATPIRANDSYNQPRRIDDQPRYRTMDQSTSTRPATGSAPEQGNSTRDEGRGRMRNADVQPQNNGQMQPAATPQDGQRRRGGFFQNVFSEPAPNGGQAAEQPRQRSYEQPRQRSYEQPRQRSYEQPQQRSYEQPQQRTYSQPSNSAPSYGGGNSGGGGGGRGRGRGE